MTNPSPLTNDSLTPSGPETDQSDGPELLQTIKGPAQFLSFWIAIALPFIHVPLLAQGLGDPTVTLTFVALLGVNALALYLGHGYNQH